jgi:hypothetical protein
MRPQVSGSAASSILARYPSEFQGYGLDAIPGPGYKHAPSGPCPGTGHGQSSKTCVAGSKDCALSKVVGRRQVTRQAA